MLTDGKRVGEEDDGTDGMTSDYAHTHTRMRLEGVERMQISAERKR
jgi:hypothetical protein